LTKAELSELLGKLSDRLPNCTTNDYRTLSAWLKNSEANAQISSKPKLMACPVIRGDDRFYLSWTVEVQKALLAN
jgi:arsenate reductase